MAGNKLMSGSTGSARCYVRPHLTRLDRGCKLPLLFEPKHCPASYVGSTELELSGALPQSVMIVCEYIFQSFPHHYRSFLGSSPLTSHN